MGIYLQSRTTDKITIKTPIGLETYNIEIDFPFTSERKRMGIIVSAEGVSGYFFYLKGADTVMKSCVPEV